MNYLFLLFIVVAVLVAIVCGQLGSDCGYKGKCEPPHCQMTLFLGCPACTCIGGMP